VVSLDDLLMMMRIDIPTLAIEVDRVPDVFAVGANDFDVVVTLAWR
jgi:hypothetical protein